MGQQSTAPLDSCGHGARRRPYSPCRLRASTGYPDLALGEYWVALRALEWGAERSLWLHFPLFMHKSFKRHGKLIESETRNSRQFRSL